MIKIKVLGDDPTKIMQKLMDNEIRHDIKNGIITIKVRADQDRDDMINWLFELIPDLRFGD